VNREFEELCGACPILETLLDKEGINYEKIKGSQQFIQGMRVKGLNDAHIKKESNKTLRDLEDELDNL
jgi:hypothetical protein